MYQVDTYISAFKYPVSMRILQPLQAHHVINDKDIDVSLNCNKINHQFDTCLTNKMPLDLYQEHIKSYGQGSMKLCKQRNSNKAAMYYNK